MPSFIAIADETFKETGFTGKLVRIVFQHGQLPDVRVLEETRPWRCEKTSTMIVSRERPPKNAHLVYEQAGYWIYETGWSIARRIRRVVDTAEERVRRAKGAINPLLYIVAETQRLVILRALNKKTTEIEKTLALLLLDHCRAVIAGEHVGRNITACFNVCKEVLVEIENSGGD